MREIKFRAWDERREKMTEGLNFIKSGDKENDWIVPVDISEKDWTEKVKNIETMPHCRQQIKLMQYTGLKDINGKEIYEGDLIEHDDEGNRYEGCIVVYDEEYGMFCFENDASNSLNSYQNLEVIGNIYEVEE